jgi:hypothetical protein
VASDWTLQSGEADHVLREVDRDDFESGLIAAFFEP